MRFEIIGGPEDGKIVDIDKEIVVIGRDIIDDLYLYYDRTISRHHVRIRKLQDSYLVRDAGAEGDGSKNGTFLNNKSMSNWFRNEERTINPSDIIYIGRIGIKFLG